MQDEVFIIGYGLAETDTQAAHYEVHEVHASYARAKDEALDLVSKVWRPGTATKEVFIEGGVTFRTEDGAEYVSVSQAWVKA